MNHLADRSAVIICLPPCVLTAVLPACGLQVFGSSPDETGHCRLYLNRETTADALTMMQPQLLAYTMEVRASFVPPPATAATTCYRWFSWSWSTGPRNRAPVDFAVV